MQKVYSGIFYVRIDFCDFLFFKTIYTLYVLASAQRSEMSDSKIDADGGCSLVDRLYYLTFSLNRYKPFPSLFNNSCIANPPFNHATFAIT